MSTREQILDALSSNPEGMTVKELAPHCSACEHDEQIVARVVAMLGAEGVIHPGDHLRDGAPFYVFGGEEKPGPVNEPVVSMNAPKVESAKPIANLPAAKEDHMAEKKMLAERAIEALKAHGPLTLEAWAKKAGTTAGTLSTYMGPLRMRGMEKQLSGSRTVPALYYIGEAQKAKLPAKGNTPEKGRGAATQGRSRNGGRGAEAHGPAFDSTIRDLTARRESLLEQVSKIDRAIEAVRALG